MGPRSLGYQATSCLLQLLPQAQHLLAPPQLLAILMATTLLPVVGAHQVLAPVAVDLRKADAGFS